MVYDSRREALLQKGVATTWHVYLSDSGKRLDSGPLVLMAQGSQSQTGLLVLARRELRAKC